MAELDFIQASPLLKSCGFSAEDVAAEAAQWNELAQLILDALQFDAANLKAAEKERVFQYYLPILMWIQRLRKEHEGEGPIMLGISAPQGCGKSTLVGCLFDVFAKLGLKAATVSIDDFYLTHADQKSLAAKYETNPLLQCRGNALTHDLPLGTDTLKKLKGLTDDNTVAVPRYDKSAFEGKGDRMDEKDWLHVQGPLDVILFEGWMLGFRARPAEDAASVAEHLLPINEALREYASAWDAFVDAWLVIKIVDPAWVAKWRLQAEQAMKKSGKPGMSDEAVQAFVNCYMPAYKAYLTELYAKGPTTAIPGKCLITEVDEHRSPTVQQPDQLV